MPEITAAMVKALREKTDLPMMECKKALTEADGDMDKAIEILQQKARGKLELKSDREASEGRIGVFVDEAAGVAGLVEVRCETAPVAKNENFIELTNDIARAVSKLSDDSPSTDVVMAAKLEDGRTVKEGLGDMFGKLRENMKVHRARKLSGKRFGKYVHHDGKTATVVVFEGKPSGEDEVIRDLCMHVAFSKPAGIKREHIPADEVEKVRAEARAQALEDGKPEKIVDKIADGKVNAWFAERVLLEQEHVKVNKTKVGDVLKQGGVEDVTAMEVYVVGL